MEKIFRKIYQLSQKGIFENKIIVFNLLNPSMLDEIDGKIKRFFKVNVQIFNTQNFEKYLNNFH